MGEKEQWYSNKELFEMVQVMKNEMAQLSAELQKTTLIIRDYNGLREEVGECRKDIAEVRTERKTTMAMWGLITGGILFFFSLMSYLKIGQ